MEFERLGIAPEIIRALKQEGYVSPTPIQEEAIPIVLGGRDLLGSAQTGTGKTAAFAIPIIQLLAAEHKSKRRNRPIRALVVTPTRELALQIYESFGTYGANSDLDYAVIYGGVSQKPQEASLRRGVDVLVVTPGRLLDLQGQGIVDLSHLEILVLDEADRMLDMGFIHDVRRIITLIPEERQTLLFSATMPPDIAKLAQRILHKPARVEVTPVSSTVDSIDQYLYRVDKGNKKNLILDLLEDRDIESALVFTRTKHGANRLVKQLGAAGISAQAIHGNKSQGARQKALGDFKQGHLRVLVATDIAARGIDVDELSHVFNYELPDTPETYVHRIGRTGRAGMSGTAITFCDFDEQSMLREIEKLIGKKLYEVKNHPYPMQQTTPSEKKPRQGQNRSPRENQNRSHRGRNKPAQKK